jgi:hypothetical protein
MLRYYQQFKDASPLTKYAILALIIWSIPIVMMTAYSYGRLDFVRSYDTTQSTEHSNSK